MSFVKCFTEGEHQFGSFPEYIHCLLHSYFCCTYQVPIVKRWVAILISHSHCYLSIPGTFPAIILSRLGRLLHVYEPSLNILILSILQTTLTWNLSFLPYILIVWHTKISPATSVLQVKQFTVVVHKHRKAYLLNRILHVVRVSA